MNIGSSLTRFIAVWILTLATGSGAQALALDELVPVLAEKRQLLK